jgi:thiol-disulfide isomerase/thioredoxin
MGRLPSVIAGALLAGSACESRSSTTGAPRSDQIVAAATPSFVAPAASSPTGHPAPLPMRARKLCEGDGNARGRLLPKTPASHAEAAGAPALDGELPRPDRQWMWINFWAAWCGPCKEEIPRLASWRDRLTKAGAPIHLVFVSLDDDERQLDLFLEAQAADGLRTTLWLPEGSTRTSWLKSLRIKPGMELPEHVLVDPSRRVRCFIEGAVDDGDYPEIAALTAP